MKVLLLNTFSAVRGGAERMVYDTAHALLNDGHAVSAVFAYDDRHQQTSLWATPVNRYYVPEVIEPLSDRRARDNYRRSPVFRSGLRYLQDIVDIEAPDIIHIHNFPSIEVLDDLRLPAPVVKTFHSYESVCDRRLKVTAAGELCGNPRGEACARLCGYPQNSFVAVRARAEKRTMRRHLARLFAVSDFVRRTLLQNGLASPERVRVLANFTSMSPRFPQTIEEPAVLYVGRVTAEKGLRELVIAVGRSATRPLIRVVGDVSNASSHVYLTEVQTIAAAHGVRLDLKGWLTGEQLRQAYEESAVVAVPSVWPEPFGLTGIEALIHAKPVIAFDGGGVRDWLEDGRNGHLVRPGDTAGLATRIDELIREPERRKAMGLHGQALAAVRFSATTHISALLSEYLEVLHEGAAHRPGRGAALRHAQRGTGVSL